MVHDSGIKTIDFTLNLIEKKDELNHKNTEIICSSDNVLGNGSITDIKHIILVDPEKFDKSKTNRIVKEIEYLNSLLKSESPYLLIGPGRWGTLDPWLGIPVNWKQISNAKTIIELGIDNLNPEPSYGSHFFQNLTSMHIGYFTIEKNKYKESIDWKWMKSQKVIKEKTYVKLIELKNELLIIIDGHNGKGIIKNNIKISDEKMDEELSTGI